MNAMKYFVYVLESIKDQKIYIGQTDNMNRRLKEHNAGKVFSTKGRRPLKLKSCEIFSSREEAVQREKFLKSGCGREFVKFGL